MRANDRFMDLIMIPSTHCNLRCSYCYELSALGDKRRMSLETLQIVFERLAEHLRHGSVPTVRFIWHGGEPLLLPPDFYWRAFEMQERCFRGIDVNIVNVTQTNLTVLDDERTSLIRDGFDAVGVSLDLFGSLRVDAGGVCREDKAIANLDSLLEKGIRLGGITVLTRANRLSVRRIYKFYRERGMGFRLLPMHAGDFGAGQWFEIGPADTLRALKTLTDLWFDDPGAPFVHPVVGVIRDVFQCRAEGRPVELYDKSVFEPLIVIDREGYVSADEDANNRARSYGSLRDAPLASLLESPMRAESLREAGARVAATCASCDHFGKTCSSFPMVEGKRDAWERDATGSIRCTAPAGLIEHIERRLIELGVISTHTEARAAAADETWRLLA